MLALMLLLWAAYALRPALAQTGSFASSIAAVPLAVRSPYFSAWMPSYNTPNGTQLVNKWPQFWAPETNPSNILGWAGHIRVDDLTYRWLGEAPGFAATNITSTTLTPTQTIYTVQAGPMNLTVTFLTPIEPQDWVRQSMPLSYLALEASSTDGRSHDVQVYSDISAEWVSGNRSLNANWSTTSTSQIIYHQVQLQTPIELSEIDNQATDGTAYYAMLLNTDTPTWQTGQDILVRANFNNSEGHLAYSSDLNFRAITDDWPVFALAVDLGSISSTSSPVVWAVGYVRDPALNYTTPTGYAQPRHPYYRTQYDNAEDMLNAFLTDFDDAQKRSTQLDQQLIQNATEAGGSANYSDLVSLAARQVFGAIDITVAEDENGHWNTSDAMIFMKSIGGQPRRVNPVETLYAASPMFLSLNASYMKPLLYPLLDSQSPESFTLPYAAADLGNDYPIASGNNNSHAQGVEQSANMIIMALAHARATGDGSLVGAYYGLLQKWTEYLVNNALYPLDQTSADNQGNANMTNLAIKGIIAIRAMAEISSALGKHDDAQSYATNASSFYDAWEQLALPTDQEQGLMFAYDDPSSWVLAYNLYADRLLQTNVVNQTVYERQNEAYGTLVSNGTARTYGLPIDSTDSISGDAGWLAFTAASVTNTSTRNELISMVHEHAALNASNSQAIFPLVYDVDTGGYQGGSASPAQGAMFALLALNVSNHTIVYHPIKTPSHNHVGAIVGGVIGGLAGAALLALAALFFWRRRQRMRAEATRARALSPYSAPETIETSTASGSVLVQSPRKGQMAMDDGHRETAISSAPMSSSSALASAGAQSRAQGSSSAPAEELNELRREMGTLRQYIQEINAPPPSYRED
ncbi:hypothetical protein FOMPIDRAFT_1057715 [Fomitopsis schrenkii]|uniref:DUF1793-domain-containing protein n=1 Tax=Fomitopsis schrenkii TaxID=2126942 RepID=S8EL43_FOMSC|nr:hypothetical protein FOMPIDRAFT_1057715 [Fomitopsis schrenkii]